jgi:hypothetical protein
LDYGSVKLGFDVLANLGAQIFQFNVRLAPILPTHANSPTGKGNFLDSDTTDTIFGCFAVAAKQNN